MHREMLHFTSDIISMYSYFFFWSLTWRFWHLKSILQTRNKPSRTHPNSNRIRKGNKEKKAVKVAYKKRIIFQLNKTCFRWIERDDPLNPTWLRRKGKKGKESMREETKKRYNNVQGFHAELIRYVVVFLIPISENYHFCTIILAP